jgi:uncharacterized protein YcsI (UPF0317 family)
MQRSYVLTSMRPRSGSVPRTGGVDAANDAGARYPRGADHDALSIGMAPCAYRQAGAIGITDLAKPDYGDALQCTQ